MRRAAQHQGFTLLELILVMFIVVLAVGAISINIGQGNSSVKLKTVARDMASALRYARGRALMTRQPAWVEFNLAENFYQVQGRDSKYEFSDQIDVTLNIAEDTFNQQDSGRILFFPDGSSTGGRIDLEWEGFLQRIDVNWLNGKIRIGNEAE
jgi:general secretion pathway protein H